MKNAHQLTVNPAGGLTLMGNRRRQDLREVYDDDLKKLFVKSPEYGRDRHNLPYKYWLPLLGLYTGARLEELAQLDPTDIIEVDGVWCLDINENGIRKSVKTSEQRIVPHHPFLVDLGLSRFAKGLPKGKLWKHLKYQSLRWSHYFCRWFGCNGQVKTCPFLLDHYIVRL